jgi:transposase InsO family protein
MTWIYFLKSKDSAPLALDKFLSTYLPTLKHWTGSTTIQSDSEPVFIGKNCTFRAVCVKHGVTKQSSAPYSPQQNGVAEKMWRTIATKANAMIHAAGLDKTYWQFAFDATVYIKNRLPTRANNGYVSPHYIVYGKHPDITNMRVWSCPSTVTLQPRPAKEWHICGI